MVLQKVINELGSVLLIGPLLDLLEDVALLERCLPLPVLPPLPAAGLDHVAQLLLALLLLLVHSRHRAVN